MSDAQALSLGISVLVLTVITVTAVIVMWRRAKRNPVMRKKELCLATSRADAVELVISAVKAVGGGITETDPDAGQIWAKFGMTFRSWGQYLQVDFWDTDLGEQQLVLSSWPTYDLTVVDWGAGNLVIDHVCDQIRELAPGEVVGTRTTGHTIRS